MLILVMLVGIFIAVMGFLMLLKPQTSKQLIAFFRKDKRVYLAGASRLVFGIIFLLAASQCRVSWLITAVGILFLVGAAIIFGLGQKKLNRFLDWWESRTPLVVRGAGCLILILAVIILDSV